MWYSNKTVNRTYSSKDSQNAWAMIDNVSGWKRIMAGSADGVTNVLNLLTIAKAHNRPVDVYIVNDESEIKTRPAAPPPELEEKGIIVTDPPFNQDAGKGAPPPEGK
jgi:adenine-specific DNA methylase